MPKMRDSTRCDTHCNSVCNHKLCFSISAVRYCFVYFPFASRSIVELFAVRGMYTHTNSKTRWAAKWATATAAVVIIIVGVFYFIAIAIFNTENMKCLPSYCGTRMHMVYIFIAGGSVCIYILWFYYDIAISIINVWFLQSCHFQKQPTHIHAIYCPSMLSVCTREHMLDGNNLH